MNILDKTRLLQTSILSSLIMGVGGVAYAQTTDQFPVDAEEIAEQEDDEFAEENEIVVTGSRVKRNEYTSISPIQVVSGEIARDLGLVEAGDILRQTTVVQGQQTDVGVSTVLQGGLGEAFTTFGSVTPSLRGLSSSVTGRSRNLVLVNGRRLGPIGVGGAPANPDVSLIPGSLIQNVDLLLDGASSIYGSDAIAGVINYQLRDDVQGLEFDAFYDRANPVDEETLTFSATTGIQSDNGFSVFAAEYRNTSGYRRIDRFNGGLLPLVETPFGDIACDPEREINRNTGEIFTGCSGFLADFTVFGPTGTTIVTPGQTNIGVDGFSRLGIAPFTGADNAGTFGSINNPFTRSFPQDQQEFVSPPVERFSIYGLGEYETGLPTDLTAYYEVSYAERELSSNQFSQGVLEVTEDTPFNPGIGSTLLVNLLEIDFDQNISVFRATGGVKGNLDFLEKAGLDNWSYDAFALYHNSRGSQRNSNDVSNINAARVLNGSFDQNGQFQCALDETLEGTQPSRGGPGGGFTTPIPNCFAVNFFDPQFLTTGRFSDEASNDFILATALQNTAIEQVTFNAFATGDLFDIPTGGTVQAVLGYEHRFDKVETINDFNQSTSNALATLNPDVGSAGDRFINEYFGELILPLVKDKPLVKSLQLEVAGRLIDEEFFGSGETYQIKGEYAPNDWLSFSAGFGTSFRAPDTGENFGTGIIFAQNVRNDPCLPSTNVLADTDGDGLIDYDFTQDERNQFTIDLCNDLGVVLPQEGDTPEQIAAAAQALGLFGIGTPSGSFQNFSVLFGNGGSTQLTPETSEALFLKASFDQPWFDSFDFRASVNYFEYEVSDSIGQLTAGNILGTCFNPNNTVQTTVVNGELVGDLCQFQTRSPTTGLLTAVNESSFNLGSLTSEGIDINAEFFADLDKVQDKLGLKETPSLGLVYRATRQFDNSEDITGDGVFNENLGEFGFPKLQQNITTTLRYGDFSLLYSFQYQDATNNGIAGDFGGGNVCIPTLLARDANADTSGCTEFIDLPDVELHNVSFTYNGDDWAFRAGVRNLLNTVPVLDTAIVGDGNTGTPFGLGYDANGRNLFVNVSKRF